MNYSDEDLEGKINISINYSSSSLRIVTLTSVNKLQHNVSWKSLVLTSKFLNQISESDDNFVFYLSDEESLEPEFEQGSLNSHDKNTAGSNNF